MAVYASTRLTVERRSDLKFSCLELLWIELKPNHSKTVLLGFIYRPPKYAKIEWFNQFEDEISSVRQEFKHVILMGDININLLNGHNTRWPNLTKSFGLSQLIDEPTCVTSETSTLLDHVLVSDIHFVQEYSCMNSVSLSEHYPVGLCWKFKSNYGKWHDGHKVIHYRKLNNKNLAAVSSNIEKAFRDISFSGCVDDSLSKFNDVVNTEMKHKAPFKVRRIKTDTLPKLFHKDIIVHINKRNKYKQKGKQHLYKQYRQKTKKLIEKSKCNYYHSVLHEAKGNPKQLRKHLENICGVETNSVFIEKLVDSDTQMVYNSQEIIVNRLNQYFSNAAEHVLKDLPITKEDYKPSNEFLTSA